MRKNTLLGVKKVSESSGGSMVLYYYATQEPQPGGETVYGIGIVKRVEGEKVEQEWIPGISYAKEDVEQLLHRMMEGTVTPVSAVSVVDDYMGAR